MIPMMIVCSILFVVGAIGLYVLWAIDLVEAERKEAARPGPNDRRKAPRNGSGRRRCDRRMSNAEWLYEVRWPDDES